MRKLARRAPRAAELAAASVHLDKLTQATAAFAGLDPASLAVDACQTFASDSAAGVLAGDLMVPDASAFDGLTGWSSLVFVPLVASTDNALRIRVCNFGAAVANGQNVTLVLVRLIRE